MKIKKILAMLSAVTMMSTAAVGSFPASSLRAPVLRAHAEDEEPDAPPETDGNAEQDAEPEEEQPEEEQPEEDVEEPEQVSENLENMSGTTADGLVFSRSHTDSDGTTYLQIEKYTGTATEIVIPEKINGYLVTEIRPQAFADQKRITKINLGCVQCIGYGAFKNCVSLKSVTIPKSIANYRPYSTPSSYDDGCFAGSGLETITFADGCAYVQPNLCKDASNLKTVVLPKSSDAENFEIGQCAFQNCGQLTSFTVPDYVQAIRDLAFAGCKRITSFKLGAGVKKLGGEMFSECVSLKELTVPNGIGSDVKNEKDSGRNVLKGSSIETVTFEKGIKCIPAYFCNGASSVKTVVLPDRDDNLDEYVIGEYAFCGTSISAIALPVSVTEIGYKAFSENKRLASVTLGESLKKVGTKLFEDCTSLKEITIPKTLTEVESHSYYGALEGSSIETVTFEEGIANIPAGICYNASKVKTVVIPEKADNLDGYKIGEKAFSGTALTEITLPDSITEIDYGAFAECKYLSKVKLSSSLTKMNGGAFENCVLLKSITIPKTLKEVIDGYYTGCFEGSGLESIVFEDGIENIPADICNSASRLKSVTLPEKADNIEGYAIGDNAFKGTALTEIALPNTITKIGFGAFCDCKNLSKVTLSSSLTTLSGGAFANCEKLKNITIPKGVTTVNDGYYTGCFEGSALESIVFEEGIENIPANICIDAAYLKTITIPEKADILDGYAIGDDAFKGTALTEVKLPESITKLGYAAFADCKSLSKVTLSSNLLTLSGSCFENCEKLKEITIPKSVKEVNDGYYNGCFKESGLETIIFEKGIENIPDYICIDAKKLRNVVLPEKDDIIDGYSIGEYAFQNTALTGIVLPDSLTEIKYYAFSDCKQLSSIQFGKNLTKLGGYIFNGCESLKELSIPATLTAEERDSKENSLSGSSIETLIFEEGVVTVPAYMAADEKKLKTVFLPDSAEEIGVAAFENCMNLEAVKSGREEIKFYPSTFRGCMKLDDPRFSIFDRENTYLACNNSLATVNGIINYTMKYKLNDSIAADASDITLNINIPEQMTLLLESVEGTGIEVNADDLMNGRITTAAAEGTIRFAARVTEFGDYQISAMLSVYSGGDYWEQRVGAVTVDCPDITFSVPEIVNDFTADVYGVAANGQPVEIYVNDKLAGTITANEYTGKYKGSVALPTGKNGDTYTLYAICNATKSDVLTTTYSSEKPVVKQVIFTYNGGQTLDITDVLYRGTSPVVSYNPSYPTGFEITATNNDRIDKLFVTSSKNGVLKFIQAFYDAKSGTWKANGYFDEDNHSYVPGTLNISIVEKKNKVLDESYKTENQQLVDVPQAYIENSSATLIGQTDNAFAAEVTVSNGTTSGSYKVYSGSDNAGLYIDGKYYTKEEIAKNPAAFGFERTDIRSAEDGKVYSYYVRPQGSNDAVANMCLALGDGLKQAGEIWSGEAFLKMAEGPYADNPLVEIANAYVTDAAGKVMEEMFGSGFGAIGKALSLGSDIMTYAGQLEMANGNSQYMAAATLLFGLKAFNTFGTELLLTALGVPPILTPLISWGIGKVLDTLDSYLMYCMENGLEFSLSGFIRFIIDPSGIVYEAVIGNPVEGATVTVYYQDPESKEAVKWNAEDYDQFNPLLTDKEGQYLWDVPEGLWKVVCEKEGYAKAETDWMTIPPVRTNVHIALVSKAAPQLAKAVLDADGLTVTFSKFVAAETVTAESLKLEGAEGSFTITPKYINEGDKYADTFILTGDSIENAKSISITAGIVSYAGTKAEAGKLAVKDQRTMLGDVNGDGAVNLKDAVMIRRYIAGGWNVEMNTAAADVNGDGTVNLKDVVTIRRYIAGGWNIEFKAAA